MDDVLKVEGLVKRYGEFVLDGVSLRVPAGCVTGFIGGNGAGKTTTIKSVLGIVMPDAGKIELLGKPVDARRDAELARAKARIGVVFDTCPFPWEARVADVAKIGAFAFPAWDALKFAQLTRDFGLDAKKQVRKLSRGMGMKLHVADVAKIGAFAFPAWDALKFAQLTRDFGLDAKKQVRKLSRGMGMKLQLAFALAHDPDLLILDEVTAGLDPIARGEVLDILRAFMCDEAAGARRGILMSSHITSDLERIADYVVCIDAVARGEVLDILRAFMCDEAAGARRGILMSSHITSDLERIADYVVCIDAGREVFSCETADITDAAGIAQVRAADCERIVESGVFERGSLRALRGDYATTLLVPDRAELKRAFPDVACERASIDDYMMLMLKGEVR